jgi:hypothetical protein
LRRLRGGPCGDVPGCGITTTCTCVLSRLISPADPLDSIAWPGTAGTLKKARAGAIVVYRAYFKDRTRNLTDKPIPMGLVAAVILRMAALGLGEPENFPFLDPPDTRLVNDGVRLLQELKAMDDQRRVTSLGAKIGGLPIDRHVFVQHADTASAGHRDAWRGGVMRYPRAADIERPVDSSCGARVASIQRRIRTRHHQERRRRVGRRDPKRTVLGGGR